VIDSTVDLGHSIVQGVLLFLRCCCFRVGKSDFYTLYVLHDVHEQLTNSVLL
jgi:hypothetical protein